MTLYLLAVDDVTGKHKRTLLTQTAQNIFVDFNFDVGAGGQTDFVVTSGLITSVNAIDVSWNGQGLREGAAQGFTRDVVNNKIVITQTLPQGAWVRVRVYS